MEGATLSAPTSDATARVSSCYNAPTAREISSTTIDSEMKT